jgi:four helix bundle protein
MEVVSRQSSVVGDDTQRGLFRGPKGYKDLDVFKRAFAMLRPLHARVLTFPDYEKYDLAQQIRRAAKSIPANIAEGYALRDAPRLFCKHLRIAYGSAAEMRTHLDVALELGYISPEEHEMFGEQFTIIAKQLYRLWQHWRRALAVTNDDLDG